ncbi:phosphotransferase [Streptomyces sp. NPDC006638]|uniref:phosphotransferase n=1 Tax=Streptomyces sp. NPDC006638 TaxID=3157183 RepID=UPI0033B94C38
MTLEGSSLGTTPAAPAIREVLSFARSEIRTAAAGLWPTATVEVVAHVPSVTGYVCRVRVGDRDLYAKYSYLGISLVSLSRGARGGWPCVRQAQRAYTVRQDALLVREAAQLRFLGALGRPRVCAVAGLHPSGVLFTERVAGPTLASLLLDRPQDTAVLMESTWSELDRLHHPQTVRRLTPADAIGERGIASTFRRKFDGVGGSLHLDRLGDERCSMDGRAELVGTVRQVVARLCGVRGPARVPGRPVLVHGDLKPEHVFFPQGPAHRPVFIDPGLRRATGPETDAAKLISRCVLLLAATAPGPLVARLVMQGVGAFAEQRMSVLTGQDHHLWVREVLALWLMDTVNVLTTCLSAPSALPLPTHGEALARRAAAVAALADRLSAHLVGTTNDMALWERSLDTAAGIGGVGR